MRIFTNMCGIVLTDSWLAMKHYMGPQYGQQDRHPLWNASVCKFAEIVSSKILSRHSKTRWRVGKEDIPLMVSSKNNNPDDSVNLSSPHDSEMDTGKVI